MTGAGAPGDAHASAIASSRIDAPTRMSTSGRSLSPSRGGPRGSRSVREVIMRPTLTRRRRMRRGSGHTRRRTAVAPGVGVDGLRIQLHGNRCRREISEHPRADPGDHGCADGRRLLGQDTAHRPAEHVGLDRRPQVVARTAADDPDLAVPETERVEPVDDVAQRICAPFEHCARDMGRRVVHCEAREMRPASRRSTAARSTPTAQAGTAPRRWPAAPAVPWRRRPPAVCRATRWRATGCCRR